MDFPWLIGTQVADSVRMECALRYLVEFIDGLPYEQLEHVPGLFDATRSARQVLPGDHIAGRPGGNAPSDRLERVLRDIYELTKNTDGMSDSDVVATVMATSGAALGIHL